MPDKELKDLERSHKELTETVEEYLHCGTTTSRLMGVAAPTFGKESKPAPPYGLTSGSPLP